MDGIITCVMYKVLVVGIFGMCEYLWWIDVCRHDTKGSSLYVCNLCFLCWVF